LLTSYVERRERGRGNNKHIRCIEMNEARRLYLDTYGIIDTVDQMIKEARVKYTCWKWWHSPMSHAKAMVVATAYEMYLECAEGKLLPSWKVEKPMTYRQFCLRLSEQMMAYDPRNMDYPGDSEYRLVTQQPKKRRRKNNHVLQDVPSLDVSTLAEARRTGRVCSYDYKKFQEHMASVKQAKNAAECDICGKRTFWHCGICKVPNCILEERRFKGCSCMFNFHNERWLGLARSDSKNLAQWRAPTQKKQQQNARIVKQVQKAAYGN
jgi:hypothetical protein